MPLVGVEWLTGVDAFAAADPTWIWSCLAVGGVGMAASVWAARRLAGRKFKSSFMQRIVDDMSDRNLRRAARALDELARFEHE